MQKGTSVKIPGQPELKVLFTKEQIAKRVELLARQIKKDYQSKPEQLVLLFVANGALYFGVDLHRALERRGIYPQMDTIKLQRYRGDGKTKKRKKPKLKLPSLPLEGKHVIIIDDVFDDGITMSIIYSSLKKKVKVASLECSVLVEKKDSKRVVPVTVKYVGFKNVPKESWIVGYGMDTHQALRGLEYIAYKVE